MLSPATLGVVTGIVGTITGLGGLVFSWINYRSMQQTKALDLRLELRKQVCDVHAAVKALPDLLKQSRASRHTVLAARGVGRSSASKIWTDEWESDLKISHALAGELPAADETYQRSKRENLESKLVEVHALAAKAAGVRDKYLAALASDDKEREHIRAFRLDSMSE